MNFDDLDPLGGAGKRAAAAADQANPFGSGFDGLAAQKQLKEQERQQSFQQNFSAAGSCRRPSLSDMIGSSMYGNEL